MRGPGGGRAYVDGGEFGAEEGLGDAMAAGGSTRTSDEAGFEGLFEEDLPTCCTINLNINCPTFWGIENFGIWLFLLSIPNIFLIFSINFSGASANEITMFNSKGNYKKANEVISDYTGIEKWIIGGHSLGGSFACAFTAVL